MRKIQIENKNIRFGLLVKSNGNNSYEQWIVKPNTFIPSNLLSKYPNQLIRDEEDYKNFSKLFKNVHSERKISFVDLIHRSPINSYSHPLTPLMGKIKKEKTEEEKYQLIEEVNKLLSDLTFKEEKKENKYDTLVFFWVNENNYVTYYIFKVELEINNRNTNNPNRYPNPNQNQNLNSHPNHHPIPIKNSKPKPTINSKLHPCYLPKPKRSQTQTYRNQTQI